MNFPLYKTQLAQHKAASTLNSRTLYLHMLKGAAGEVGGQGCDLHEPSPPARLDGLGPESDRDVLSSSLRPTQEEPIDLGNTIDQ
jgi:hypothetical protein